MQQSNANPATLTNSGYRILDTLNSSILCLDSKRHISYVNAAGEALFESSAASLGGRLFDSLLSQLEPSSILSKLALDSIAFTEHEAVITLANGKSIIADYSIYPFGNQPQGGEIVLEIRPLERQAQFAQDELNHLQQQATQQLARGLAHEINNPLGGIRGAAQLLQKALDRPKWSEYTEVIISEDTPKVQKKRLVSRRTALQSLSSWITGQNQLRKEDLPTDDQYIQRARDMYHSGGEVEVDQQAEVSRAEEGTEEGAYVNAWVWVSKEEVS